MSTVRLYYPENIIENSTSLLSKEHTHYIVNVMRLKRGSKINFFNKEGEWLSEIVFLDRDRVEIKFLNKIKESFPTSNIELAICLVKKNPMEIILQKATELGVSRIIPIISERTEVKDLNLERANKITIEATEQSDQLNPPKISQMIDLKDFINPSSVIIRNSHEYSYIDLPMSCNKASFKSSLFDVFFIVLYITSTE